MVTAGNAARPAPTRLPPRTGMLAARENRLRTSRPAPWSTACRNSSTRPAARSGRAQPGLSGPERGSLRRSDRKLPRAGPPGSPRDRPQAHRRSGPRLRSDRGARRHWTVTWLRANNYPEFRFLVEPRELTDEEAFRLADLENRSAKDLSDYDARRITRGRSTAITAAVSRRWWSGSMSAKAG